LLLRPDSATGKRHTGHDDNGKSIQFHWFLPFLMSKSTAVAADDE
jgi:hypothetical protein